MSTIRYRFLVEGVLTDPTSMKLSDATSTYGVKRDDTGAVVVADGVAMTRLSLGDYEHNFTDPAFDLTYTYALEIVHDGLTYYIPGDLAGPASAAAAVAAAAKLSAVNELLEALHEYPFAALDTGGVSMAGQAERVLDRIDKRVQADGWHCNREYDVTIETADTTKMAMIIAAGAWAVATKTLTKVASFAAYIWASGDQIYVSGGTGVTAGWYEIASRTSDDAIVLKEEIAAANNADTTTTLIGWEDALVAGNDVLRLDSYSGSASKDVVLRNGMLYDRDDNTFSFDDEMTVTLVRQLDFTHLSEVLQALIIADAAVEFQEFAVAGKAKDASLRDKAMRARIRARREEQKVAQLNVLETEHAYRMRGESSVYYPTR